MSIEMQMTILAGVLVLVVFGFFIAMLISDRKDNKRREKILEGLIAKRYKKADIEVFVRRSCFGYEDMESSAVLKALDRFIETGTLTPPPARSGSNGTDTATAMIVGAAVGASIGSSHHT